MRVKGTLFIGVLLALLLQADPTLGTDYRACMDCHRGIETMDTNHAFPCQDCHLHPEDRLRKRSTHDSVVRYPGAPEHMDTFCGGCHQQEIARLRNSLHTTMAGIIGQTRYLWGAQDDPMPRYAPSPHPELKALPEALKQPRNPPELVDDLLNKRCLACHIGRVPPQEKGYYRGLGCSACHVLYADDGLYKGDDPAMKGRKGYPRTHTFADPIPVQQCLHCHNGPRVGADYPGMFEHDYHHSYRTPWKTGSQPDPVYLMDHHRLRPDIHFQKGLLCVDCHDKGDVMGRGVLARHEKEAVRVRCEDCHGPARASGRGGRAIHSGKEGTVFVDRQGRRHPLPQWNEKIPAHSVPRMQKLHCTSCHGGWGFYDYGMSLMRDDRVDLSHWGAWRLQGDETVAGLFDYSGLFLGTEQSVGAWFLGWRFRRWENLTLGVDGEGRITPLRPHYQYLISYVDREGKVILDNVVPERGDGSGPGWASMPFVPHTVQPRGRSCEECHGQELAAGRGLWRGEGPDLMLTKASPPVYPGMRLLNQEETVGLLRKGPFFRRMRSRALNQAME